MSCPATNMSKLCILALTTSITSIGLIFYQQINGFDTFSSHTVNGAAVKTFLPRQQPGGQVIVTILILKH